MFVLCCSEKGELEAVAAAKIKQLTSELEATAAKPFNPVERIQTGFARFKKEKFEYVDCTKKLLFRIFTVECFLSLCSSIRKILEYAKYELPAFTCSYSN